jgi:type IV pilus biogenesis protein CpaD/CtpE
MNRLFFRFILLAAAMVALAGCTSMGGVTGYDYFHSELTSVEFAPVADVHEATLKALEQLDMPVRKANFDDLVSVVSTQAADGVFFDIVSEWRSSSSTAVMISVPQYEHRYKAQGLLEQIQGNLAM